MDDIPQFIKHLLAQDDVALIVRMHLYVEVLLERLIAASVENPGALGKRMSFDSKVKLASALGVLGDLESAVRAINEVRNKAAHDLNFQLGPEIDTKLIKSLPSRLSADEAFAKLETKGSMSKAQVFAGATVWRTRHNDTTRASHARS
jgi:hypothetical protein